MLAVWLMLACTGATEGVTDDGGGDDGGGDEGGDDGGGPNLDAPTVLALDVYCCNPAAGPEAWYWSLTAQVSDPQGVETIADGTETGHEVNVYNGAASGEPIVDYGPGFHCDDKGACDVSWQQQTDNIMCSSASDYTIELIVADEDGNLSDASEVKGHEIGC